MATWQRRIHDHAEAEALRAEREEWLRDQAAVAEWESWILHKTIMEADADNLSIK